MSKAFLPIVNGATAKGKKIYTVLDGITHIGKKGYIVEDGLTRQFFGSATIITYTGKYSRETVEKDGAQYNLYTLASSGTLSVEGNSVEYWMCGGGAGGNTAYSTGSASSYDITAYSGYGGGGGQIATGNITEGSWTIVIGSGGAASSSGGNTEVKNSENTYSANGGTGIDGGSGGGGYARKQYGYSSASVYNGGSGAGLTTIPFDLSIFDQHCAGGGGGALYVDNTGSTGGAGGSNGSDGSAATKTGSSDSSSGTGGSKGGGNGGSTGSNGTEASYYGSGGGGGGALGSTTPGSTLTLGTGGNGYQGIVYLIVPTGEDESEEPATVYTLTMTGASSTGYVTLNDVQYTSDTQIYVSPGAELTVTATGVYNSITENGTTVASNNTFSSKAISYTFLVSADTTVAFTTATFSGYSATITY